MIGGFTAIITAFAIETNLFNMQNQLSSLVLGKVREQFAISAQVDQSNHNQLSITVTNTGTTPVQIADFWVINKTASSAPATLFTVNYTSAFVPSTYTNKIIDSGTPLYMTPGKYTVKVVSEKGTEQLVSFNVPYYPLVSKVTVVPEFQHIGQNATVIVTVTNLGNSTIDRLNCTVGVNPRFYTVFTNTTSTIPKLPPSGSATFVLEYQLAGSAGIKVPFNGTVTGIDEATGFKVRSNSTSDSVLLDSPSLTTRINAQLTVTPKMFIIDADPFGKSASNKNSYGYFGMTVSNPTNQTMSIYRAVIEMNPPSDAKIVSKIGKCPATKGMVMIKPGTGWCVPTNNFIVWNETASGPVVISPFSSADFMAGVISSATTDNPSVHLIYSVYSSVGYFVSVGHATATRSDEDKASIVNIYSTSDNETGTTPAGSGGTGNDAQFQGAFSAARNTPIDLWVTVREGNTEEDSGGASYIGPGGGNFLIIDIPNGLGIMTANNNQDGGTFGAVTIKTYSDTTQQILVPITKNIGDKPDTDSERASFKFTVTTPNVQQSQLYVFYMFLNGTDNNRNWVGPIQEGVVLSVHP